MHIVRQVELDALTFTQYDNGISEIKYRESSERAVEGFSRFLNMLIREASSTDTIRLLSDLSQTGSQPLAYHYKYIAALNSKYEPQNRPFARFANIYEELSVSRRMVLKYMRSLEMPGVELNMFPVNQRTRAHLWLLDDNSTE